MLLASNATVDVQRSAYDSGSGLPVWSQVAAAVPVYVSDRIQALGTFKGAPVYGLEVFADTGANIDAGDQLTGYNPWGLPDGSVVLQVLHVALKRGNLLAHNVAQVIATSFPDTATVNRLTATPDGQGGTTNAYASIGTTPCRLSQSGTGAGPVVIGERLDVIALAEVAIPATADVRVTDHLTVYGREFLVQDVVQSGVWDIVKAAICKETVGAI